MIRCEQLSKSFGHHRVLNAIDINIISGEFFSLLGPSGCGKTTLLRLIGGFDFPEGGSVWIDGQEMTTQPPFRRPVNQVFQSYALFPHLTVEQNIAFGLKMSGVPRNEIQLRVREAMSLVSLTGLERRKPAQLSGGQKQRVALARAIINRPKVLLLDEPLAALDAQLRHAVQLELKQLQRQLGITFVFVTHDQDEAMLMSDRLAVMNAGSILQIGSPRDVYEQPRQLSVATFIGQANQLDVRSLGIWSPRLSERVRDLCPNGATLIIRPQDIRRCSELDADFQAVVTQQIFRGETAQQLLQVQNGPMLTASGWSDASGLAAGASVYCQIDRERLLCFDTAGLRVV